MFSFSWALESVLQILSSYTDSYNLIQEFTFFTNIIAISLEKSVL